MFAAVSAANKPSGRGGGLSFADLLCCFTRSIREPEERYVRASTTASAAVSSRPSPATATHAAPTSSSSSEPVSPQSPRDAPFELSGVNGADRPTTRLPHGKRVSVSLAEDTEECDDAGDDPGFVEIPTELLSELSSPPTGVRALSQCPNHSLRTYLYTVVYCTSTSTGI